MKKIILITIALMLVGGSLEARALRFKCNYTTWASPDGVKKVQKSFKLEFALDTTTGKAMMIGNNGVENVRIASGKSVITFLERIPTGVIQTTSVSLETGASIHSRHTYFAREKDFIPSQYYGHCIIK